MQSLSKAGRAGSAIWWVLGLAALALIVVLLTQRAAAAAVGGAVAQIWVSVMNVVLQLVGAMFGG